MICQEKRSKIPDGSPVADEVIRQAREVIAIEAEGLNGLQEQVDNGFVRAVDMIMSCPGRVIVTGLGKSGIIGQKISATMNSVGTPCFFLHPVEAMHGDLGMVSHQDVVIAISYSGETRELNALVSGLSKRCAGIIAITGFVGSSLTSIADVVLPVRVEREACPLGLAPTASTTATLAMGDALAVVLLQKKQFKASDFRKNHPGGKLGERLRVQVAEVMITGDCVPVVSRDTQPAEAVATMNAKNLGAVVVVNLAKRVVGIITDGDIRRLVASGIDLQTATLEECMTADPKTIAPDLLAADALSMMQRHEITVLPVTRQDRLLAGILHLHDLLGKGEFRFLV